MFDFNMDNNVHNIFTGWWQQHKEVFRMVQKVRQLNVNSIGINDKNGCVLLNCQLRYNHCAFLALSLNCLFTMFIISLLYIQLA